jgi:hypothetical protein
MEKFQSNKVCRRNYQPWSEIHFFYSQQKGKMIPHLNLLPSLETGEAMQVTTHSLQSVRV